jgi:hypothetical protein
MRKWDLHANIYRVERTAFALKSFDERLRRGTLATRVFNRDMHVYR